MLIAEQRENYESSGEPIGKAEISDTVVKEERVALKNISELQGKTAKEIQELCGISNMMPISFDQLKKRYKIKIFGADLSYVSLNCEEAKNLIEDDGIILGMVKVKDGFANIYYNNNKSIDIPTQRFTIAHELAHCIYDGEELSLEEKVDYLFPKRNIKKNKIQNDNEESMCDKFARDFLIPSDMLITVCKIIPNLTLKVLSNLFMVPEDEMEEKLKEMKIVL